MKTIISLLLLLSLVGCGSNEVRTVTTDHYITKVYILPETHTAPIAAPKPPSISEYTNADEKQREELLVKYTNQLLLTIDKLNTRLKSIVELQAKQKKTAEEENNASAKK